MNHTDARSAVHFGRLPKLDRTPIPTTAFDFGLSQAALGIEHGGIVTFDGRAGIGKTTTATVAAQDSHLRFVYSKLREGVNTKAVALALFRALYPGVTVKRSDNEDKLITECTDALLAGNIGVLADEVHRIKVSGMLLLTNIWDTVKDVNGQGFPLFLVGAKVHAAISPVEELDSRIFLRTSLHALEPEESIDAAQRLNARCAATSPALLTQVDRLHVNGRLREWGKLFTLVDMDPAKAGTAISADEVRGFLIRQGVALKNGKLT